MERSFLYCMLMSSIVLTSFGCNNNAQIGDNSQISVNTYIDNLVEKLNENTKVQKVVVIQGNADTSEISKKEFEEDLEFYRKIDISARSLNGKYDVDTIRNEQTTTVVYEANTKGLEVRSQKFVYSNEGKLLKITSVREFNSVVSDFVQNIEFYPDSLLRIDQSQDVTGRGKQTLLIEHHL